MFAVIFIWGNLFLRIAGKTAKIAKIITRKNFVLHGNIAKSHLQQKELKSMTFFNQLTFFHADINQSEVEDSFQLASDWIKSVRKNVNTLLGSLL